IYLWEYDWPGNIRELENLIERLVLLSDNGIIDLKDLPPNIRSYVSDKKCPNPTLGDGQIDLRDATEQLQYRWMKEALRLTNATKSAAAKMLGLKRTTLVAKLRRKPRPNGGPFTLVSEPEEPLAVFLAASDAVKDR